MKEIKKVLISGFLKYDYKDNWHTIYLLQTDGYMIDLISRLSECSKSFGGNVQINYHISDNEMTYIQALEKNILSISGGITAEFEADHYRYSSYTSGTDYNSICRIGKHDLYKELRSVEGKYIIFDLNFN